MSLLGDQIVVYTRQDLGSGKEGQRLAGGYIDTFIWLSGIAIQLRNFIYAK